MFQFQNLLDEYFNQNNDSARQVIDDKIWQSFEQTGAIMIMDMSGFSLVTQRYGIVYYLSMIQRMRTICQPIVEANDGELIKFVADNVFARFKQTQDAIKAALAINLALDDINKKTPKMWDIQVSTGIDYGRYLYTDDKDVFGDSVNCASKLGEDIAASGEILVTETAMAQLPTNHGIKAELLHFKISGIALNAYKVNYNAL